MTSRHHTTHVLSSGQSHLPRREQSPAKCVLPNSMLILRNTAGLGELDAGSTKCCLAESSRNLRQEPNKAAVYGALDPSLGAAGGKWTEFLLNQPHSESSQVSLDSEPGEHGNWLSASSGSCGSTPSDPVFGKTKICRLSEGITIIRMYTLCFPSSCGYLRHLFKSV